MSLPAEILKKVRLLELHTRKLVNTLFAGQYHSAFKGQGMTFAEFREYVPGDDVRAIAWPLTARTGKTFIKKFDEERELTLMLMVDVSGSVDFGSTEYFKGEAITHLAALLSFSASKNNDQIGLLLFSDQVEHFVPPKKGRGHVHRILRDLYYFKPQSRRTQMAPAIDYVLGVLKKRSTVFVISDFMADGFEKQMRMLGRKHDTVAVVMQDPLELSLPPLGLVEWQDAETGETVLVDTSSTLFRRHYEKQVQARLQKREQQLRKSKVERIEINTGQDLVDPLVAFFKRRQAR